MRLTKTHNDGPKAATFVLEADTIEDTYALTELVESIGKTILQDGRGLLFVPQEKVIANTNKYVVELTITTA